MLCIPKFSAVFIAEYIVIKDELWLLCRGYSRIKSYCLPCRLCYLLITIKEVGTPHASFRFVQSLEQLQTLEVS